MWAICILLGVYKTLPVQMYVDGIVLMITRMIRKTSRNLGKAKEYTTPKANGNILGFYALIIGYFSLLYTVDHLLFCIFIIII